MKVVSKEAGLLYFDPTETVIRQGSVIPAKGIMKVRPNVPFEILVVNVANILEHVPKHEVLPASTESIVDIVDPGKSTKNVAM